MLLCRPRTSYIRCCIGHELYDLVEFSQLKKGRTSDEELKLNNYVQSYV